MRLLTNLFSLLIESLYRLLESHCSSDGHPVAFRMNFDFVEVSGVDFETVGNAGEGRREPMAR